MGSVLFRDHRPGRDAFVAAKLKEAGAILPGKMILGELRSGRTGQIRFDLSQFALPRKPKKYAGNRAGVLVLRLCLPGLGRARGRACC